MRWTLLDAGRPVHLRRAGAQLSAVPDALARLRRLCARHPHNMMVLRRMLAQEGHGRGVERMTEAEVIRHVATLLGRGVLQLGTLSRLRARGSSGGSSPPEAPPPEEIPEEPTLEPAAAPPPPAPAPIDEEELDALVQAAALRAAAQSGAPFCERCERERLRQQRQQAA
ncbi:MAG: hypothetical protein AAGI71_05540 [Bacteroidota bacterium]